MNDTQPLNRHQLSLVTLTTLLELFLRLNLNTTNMVAQTLKSMQMTAIPDMQLVSDTSQSGLGIDKRFLQTVVTDITMEI